MVLVKTPLRLYLGAWLSLHPAVLKSDALERRNDIVWDTGIDNPSIVIRPRVLVSSLEIFVLVEPPRAVHDDNGRNSVIPPTSHPRIVQVCAPLSSAKIDVLVDDDFRQRSHICNELNVISSFTLGSDSTWLIRPILEVRVVDVNAGTAQSFLGTWSYCFKHTNHLAHSLTCCGEN